MGVGRRVRTLGERGRCHTMERRSWYFNARDVDSAVGGKRREKQQEKKSAINHQPVIWWKWKSFIYNFSFSPKDSKRDKNPRQIFAVLPQLKWANIFEVGTKLKVGFCVCEALRELWRELYLWQNYDNSLWWFFESHFENFPRQIPFWPVTFFRLLFCMFAAGIQKILPKKT